MTGALVPKNKMEKTFTDKQRTNIRIGAFAILIDWLLLLAAIVFIVYLIAYGIYSGSRNISISRFTNYIFLAGVLLLILSGAVYIVMAFRVHCPSCNFALLKNPKGFGPVNFQYHPSCAKVRGFNPWTYQIVRAIKNKKIRCVKCGIDYEID